MLKYSKKKHMTNEVTKYLDKYSGTPKIVMLYPKYLWSDPKLHVTHPLHIKKFLILINK